MSEAEKALAGELYDANADPALIAARTETKRKLQRYNSTDPGDLEGRRAQLASLLGRMGEGTLIEQPFYCDYGSNIQVGARFYANFGLVILDPALVTIGDDVFIAPNVGLHTAGHPLDAQRRNRGLEFAKPIRIGNSVWIGAAVQVLPGVSIGDGAVIGAGSVVTRDVPPGVLAFGNPCRVVRALAPG